MARITLIVDDTCVSCLTLHLTLASPCGPSSSPFPHPALTLIPAQLRALLHPAFTLCCSPGFCLS